MTLYTVRHVTLYRYKQPVAFGEHRLMLSPREDHDQRLVDLNLEISPKPNVLRWGRDVFGNGIAIAHFSERAATLRFESTMCVDHSPTEFVDEDVEDSARNYPFSYAAEDLPHLIQFVERPSADPHGEVAQWACNLLVNGCPTSTRALLVQLTRAVRETFKYVARHEKGIQEPLVTLKSRSGSCRDMAVFMIDAVRSLGMAARFVSGYLHVRSSPGSRDRGGNTHAWVQVYLPGCGWIDFDPSSGIVGNRGLVRAAVVRDPRQAIPLQGVWIGKAGHCLGMKVEVRVTRAEVDESERLSVNGVDVGESGERAVLMPPKRRLVPA
jgi:transglutaminase-like putative cysteine protease